MIAKKIRRLFVSLPRISKRLIMASVDFCVFVICALFILRFLFAARIFPIDYLVIGVAAGVIGVVVGWQQGIYNTIVRYVGPEYFHRANISTAIATLFVAFLGVVIKTNSIASKWTVIDPFKWAIFYWAIVVLYICYSRYISRTFLTQDKSITDRERVIIYGAGSAGAQLVDCLQSGKLVLPIAMIDDDASLYGTTVRGIPVYSPDDIEEIVRLQGISRILLAIPSASRRRRRIVIESLVPLPAHVQTIPDFQDLVSGKAQFDDIREVELADLMGRSAVPSDPQLLHACIEGKTVLVTGAGGSIGSELCRQILQLNVKKLLLFEISEVSLYRIDRELRRLIDSSELKCEVVPLLGSVCDRGRVADILQAYGVQTIYHAAAYKHVPMVEHNLIDGVRNNTLGTYRLALEACKAQVESFVLVSTDKAVRPTNAMGASKRIAELVLQALQTKWKRTCFSMVRFGNVLESSGSVVPLFREQIRQGGPLTVTHRDIMRYFMTIQEAAELVIQAGSEADGGDVFVLDMGEPVKILDLARRMINLTGMTINDKQNPDGDIEIIFTGLRPGEKLFEELLVGEDVFGTKHPRIMRAVESFIPLSQLEKMLGRLSVALDDQDCVATRKILFEMVDNYKPTNEVEDLVWMESHRDEQLLDVSNVIKITSHPKRNKFVKGTLSPDAELNRDNET